jgi:stage II sporulation protein D
LRKTPRRRRLSPLFVLAAVLAAPAPARSGGKALLEQARRNYFKGDLERAAAIYAQVPEGDMFHPEAVLNRAVTLAQLGKPEEALREWVRCERLLPKSHFVRRQLGWTYFSLESYETAAYWFQRALEGDSDSWESLLGLGWSYARRNQHDRALAAYQKNLADNPDSAILYYMAGRLFERMGRARSALTVYGQALKRDHAMAEARIARDALRAGEDRPLPLYRRLLRMVPGSGFVLRTLRQLAARSDYPDVPPAEAVRELPPLELAPPRAPSARFSRARKAQVRVGLGLDDLGRPPPWRELSFTCRTDFDVKDGEEEPLRGEAGDVWKIQWTEGGLLTVRDGAKVRRAGLRSVVVDPRRNGAFVIERLAGPGGERRGGEYRGVLEIHAGAGGLRLVNEAPIEDYLASVVPSEMIPSWPLEAFKAQAVLSRSLVALGDFHREEYSLCSGQHCQVYRGLGAETPAARRAVEETRDEVLTYGGKVAHGVYSSNCGGHTQSGAELVKWTKAPYWRGVPDGSASPPLSPAAVERWVRSIPKTHCRPSRRTLRTDSRWVRLVSASYLEERLKQGHPDIGRVQRLVARRRSRSGHVNALEIVGAQGSVVVDREHKIRNLLAPGSLRSTLFTIQTVHEAGRPALFVVWGGGWGHGVGLCQAGAATLAAEKRNYKDILKHYFPACRLAKLRKN